MDEPEHTYGLVMPFVVCEDQGGPYSAAAFVAGCWYGQISEEVKGIALGHKKEWYVPSPLVPQLDLLAMHHGHAFRSEPWDEHPDEWTWVEISRPTAQDNGSRTGES